ncbi:MAG: restriction endonuclease subunit S [Euryarchaeota archaeon]|nr:restriction endonuclease subunit S [Euryarchaeota archaeon]
MDVEGWQTRQLCELADIRISNVDKKFYDSEKPVKLCNYMDVYANEYVTGNIQFMEASATPAEIERFSLNCGDVIITKDSETPDDIGVPAVITEEINDLVCGYHLALIRPDQEYLNPVYLAKQLCTSDMVRHFAIKASGSTRFGLSIRTIETVEIPTPPKPEQTKISEVLSTVDRAIEQTEAIIAKQQRIKTGLMQDLLTRGIDEHGSIRSEETHEFKDSPLGRIPVEWDLVSISGVSDVRGRVGWKGYTVSDLRDSGPLALGAAQISTDYHLNLSRPTHLSIEKYEESPEIMVHADDILVVQRGNSIGKVVLIDRDIGPATINPSMILLTKLKVSPQFVYATLITSSFQKQLSDETSATGVPMISQAQLQRMQIPKPREEEQLMICKILSGLFDSIHSKESALLKIRSLKTALMHDLLTGKMRVTHLLTEPQEAGA